MDEALVNPSLEKQMEIAREVVESGHAKRKIQGLKVRMPLAKLELKIDSDAAKISPEIWEIVLKELNIKNIIVNKIRYPKKEVKVSKEELTREGELRELLRRIQNQRKELGLKPTDKIILTLPKQFLKDQAYWPKKVLLKKIVIGEELKINI